MLEPNVWELSSRIYIHNTQVDDFAYVNGNYVVIPNDIFDKSNSFEKIFLSRDFDFWDCRDVNVFDFPVRNVEMIGSGNLFVLSGSMKKDDGLHFVAMESVNGFDWTVTFVSTDVFDNYVPNKMTKYGGTTFSLCKGNFFVGVDQIWTNYRLPDEYVDFEILDNCYKDGCFYFLCKCPTASVIIVTDDYMKFLNSITLDNDIDPYSIETDTNIIIVVGRDTHNNSVISVLDDSDEWTDVVFSKPNSTNEICTFYDILHYNGEWIVVGMVEMIGNIPLKGLCYRFNSDIVSSNVFVEDEIPMKSLQRIEVYEDYLYSYGGITNQGGYVYRRLV